MPEEVFQSIYVKEFTLNSSTPGQINSPAGTAAAPSLSFGKDSGFYEVSNDVLGLAINGSNVLVFNSTRIEGDVTGDVSIELANSGGPRYSFFNDTDTGIGRAGSDDLIINIGGIIGIELKEVSSHILRKEETHVGLTADTGSAQGGLPLISSTNVLSVCANAGDSCTLPATFLVGTVVKIKNDGAQSCDVFPASGDNLGAGADTAAALASGASITYIATVANSTWTSIGN